MYVLSLLLSIILLYFVANTHTDTSFLAGKSKINMYANKDDREEGRREQLENFNGKVMEVQNKTNKGQNKTKQNIGVRISHAAAMILTPIVI